MKRSLALLLAAALALGCCSPALGEGSWVSVLQAATGLLTETTNVTLTLQADLTYNRQRFKSVSLLYIQDGTNSLTDLSLSNLRTNGTLYESGYVVHRLDGVTHTIPDRRRPAVQTGTYIPYERTPLTLTAGQQGYLNTALQLAGLMDSLMPRSVQAEKSQTGETVTLRFQQDASIGLLDSLTLSLVRDAAEKYLGFAQTPEAVGINTVSTPYDYTDLTVEYWDWDEAYAREYEALYGEKPGEDQMGDQTVLRSLAQDAADKSSAWTSGMVRILQDGRTEYYPTYDEYLLETGGQYIRYEDEREALEAYYQESRGKKPPRGEDLSALRKEMDEWYGAKLREQFPQKPACGAVYRGGKLVPFDSVRLTGHAFETYTRQILWAMSELRWGSGDFDCELDSQGRLTEITGEFIWQVVNHTGEAHPLRVSFSLNAEGFGDSRVDAFSADDWTRGDAGRKD